MTRQEFFARRGRGFLFLGLCCSYFLVYFHRLCGAVLGAFFSPEFGVGEKISWFAAAYLYPYAIMQIPSGLLTDAFGPRALILLSQALICLGAVALGLSPSFGWIIFARTLIGIGSALFYLPALAVLAILFPLERFGFLSGLLITAGNFGGIAAAAPLALAAQKVGWRSCLFFLGGLAGMSTVMMYSLLRLVPQQCKKAPTPRVRPFGLRRFLEDLRSRVLTKELVVLSTWMFLMTGTKLGFQSIWAGHYLSSVQRLTLTHSGVVLLFLTLGQVVGSPLSGFLSDASGSCKMILFSFSLGLSASWLILYSWPANMPLVSNVVMFFAVGIVSGAFVLCFSWVRKIYCEEAVGFAMGIVNSVSFLASALFAQLFGGILGPALPARESSSIDPAVLELYRSIFLVCFISMVIATSLLIAAREPSELPSETKS